MSTISADAISEIRKAFDFTQEEFGQLFFISAKTVMRWEQKKSLPTQGQVDILKAFQKGISRLEKEVLRITFIFEGTSQALYYLLKLTFKENFLCGQK